jgi:hypothetical protein
MRLPRLLLLALLLLLVTPAACARSPVPRPELAGEPIARKLPARIGELELERAWILDASTLDFGGISAVRLAGDRLLLLSDRSRLFAARWPQHLPDRWFTTLLLAEDDLARTAGRRLDSEAMALLPDGRLVVADEERGDLVELTRSGRVLRTMTVERLASPAGTNAGVEALDRLPDGTLLALREDRSDAGPWHPAVRLGEEEGVPLRYRAAPGFRPVDLAAAGPWLFVVERQVSLLGGWQARIVVLPVARLPRAREGLIEGRELARIAGPDLGENYEALAVTPRPEGGFLLLLVADDNFSALQRTQLLALTWRPEAGDVAD